MTYNDIIKEIDRISKLGNDYQYELDLLTFLHSINKHVNKLSIRQRNELIFVMYDKLSITYDRIGKLFNVSRQRIHQLISNNR